MILVDEALKQLERPICVGMIGAGFQARGIALQLLRYVPGVRLCGIANRNIERAIDCFEDAGIRPVFCDTSKKLQQTIDCGGHAVTDDAELMAAAPQIDAIIEVTGSVEYAARAVMAALRAGKHVIQMNAELDGTIGPILKRYADEAGVIFTFSDGDQPGVQMNLLRFVRGMGITPLLAGNVKGLHDPYRNPETQADFAAKWGQNPAMVASFADGTKISFEQAIVANANGFRVATRGMLGPDFSGGDPSSPLVPIEEAAEAFAEHLDPGRPPLVDYVVGARPGPGVFVIGTTDDLRQRHYLNLYKLGPGPFYVFHTPYHLCHFEVPNSIARVVLFGDTILASRGAPTVGVIALAKTTLTSGVVIEDFGGFEVYGVAENIDVIRKEGLLPIGVALGCTVKRDVLKDQPLTFDDVAVPAGRLLDRLYAEQDSIFFPSTSGQQHAEVRA